MTNSMNDILANRDYEAPSEVRIIKDYIRDNFESNSLVSVGPRTITISVDDSALAGSLRPKLQKIKEICSTEKKLVIRII